MKETEKAWLAGIIDADGSITLTPAGRFRKPLIVVDNTDRGILDELFRLLRSGKIVKKKRYKENHSQAWSWRVYGTDRIIEFLNQLLPYLRNTKKKKRAEMLTGQYKSLTKRNGRYSEDEARRKLDFEQEFLSS